MPAPVDGILEAPDIQVVLREVEVFLLVRHSVQLHAVDRVALAPAFDRFVDVRSRLNDPPSAGVVNSASLDVRVLAPKNAALTPGTDCVRFNSSTGKFGE